MPDITYTPQFQPPVWRDNVDLVSAEGPNGFNIQFQNLRDELNTLSSVVQQLSKQISDINNALGQVRKDVTDAAQAASTAQTAADTAKTAAGTARTAAGTAQTAADLANNTLSAFNTTNGTMNGQTILTSGTRINLKADNGKYCTIYQGPGVSATAADGGNNLAHFIIAKS